MTDVHPRMGRRYAPDPHDARYPLGDIAPAVSARTSRYWPAHRFVLDQEGPRCTAYSACHVLTDSPVPHTWLGDDTRGEVLFRSNLALRADPFKVYDRAQELDEFPDTPPAGGSSVRAAQKALQELGFVTEYRWTQDVSVIVQTILALGPVQLGTNFYVGMEQPASDGWIGDPFAGGVAGGHAYVLNGVNAKRGWVRMKNSWGRGWGHGGHARFTLQALDRLMAEDGEACYSIVEAA